MHVVEMESEARKTRLFTDARFKLKSQHYAESLKEIEEMTEQKIAQIDELSKTKEEEHSIRLEDFKTLLDTRVTKEYVEIIGNQIKSGIIEGFERKNEETIEMLHTKVHDIKVSQDQHVIEIKGKLKEYRGEITKFKKDFAEKASKQDFKKTLETMHDNRQ